MSENIEVEQTIDQMRMDVRSCRKLFLLPRRYPRVRVWAIRNIKNYELESRTDHVRFVSRRRAWSRYNSGPAGHNRGLDPKTNHLWIKLVWIYYKARLNRYLFEGMIAESSSLTAMCDAYPIAMNRSAKPKMKPRYVPRYKRGQTNGNACRGGHRGGLDSLCSGDTNYIRRFNQPSFNGTHMIPSSIYSLWSGKATEIAQGEWQTYGGDRIARDCE